MKEHGCMFNEILHSFDRFSFKESERIEEKGKDRNEGTSDCNDAAEYTMQS